MNLITSKWLYTGVYLLEVLGASTPQTSNIDTKKWTYFKEVHLFQTIILDINVSFGGCRFSLNMWIEEASFRFQSGANHGFDQRCSFWKGTVDGSEILHKLMVDYPIQGSFSRWLAGFLPSTVSQLLMISPSRTKIWWLYSWVCFGLELGNWMPFWKARNNRPKHPIQTSHLPTGSLCRYFGLFLGIGAEISILNESSVKKKLTNMAWNISCTQL